MGAEGTTVSPIIVAPGVVGSVTPLTVTAVPLVLGENSSIVGGVSVPAFTSRRSWLVSINVVAMPPCSKGSLPMEPLVVPVGLDVRAGGVSVAS